MSQRGSPRPWSYEFYGQSGQIVIKDAYGNRVALLYARVSSSNPMKLDMEDNAKLIIQSVNTQKEELTP